MQILLYHIFSIHIIYIYLFMYTLLLMKVIQGNVFLHWMYSIPQMRFHNICIVYANIMKPHFLNWRHVHMLGHVHTAVNKSNPSDAFYIRCARSPNDVFKLQDTFSIELYFFHSCWHVFSFSFHFLKLFCSILFESFTKQWIQGGLTLGWCTKKFCA